MTTLKLGAFFVTLALALTFLTAIFTLVIAIEEEMWGNVILMGIFVLFIAGLTIIGIHDYLGIILMK